MKLHKLVLVFSQSRRTKKLAAEKAVAPLGGESVVLRL
jgi:hypothetical protein